jgi:hypothetical protein
MTARYDLIINKNEPFNLYIEYTDDTGNLVDFIGPTADNPRYYSKMMIKRYVTDEDALVLLKSYPFDLLSGSTSEGLSGGILLNRNSTNTGGQTGGVFLTMNSFATFSALPAGKLFYDIFVIKTPSGVSAGLTGGVSTKLLEGSVDVRASVTTNVEDNFAQFLFGDEIDGGGFP